MDIMNGQNEEDNGALGPGPMFHVEGMGPIPVVGQTVPFIDREVSWLKFNQRVLNLVFDETIPLLERVKFLSITNSNLDEFFAIRVASRLKEAEEADDDQAFLMPHRIIRSCIAMQTKIDEAYVLIENQLRERNINISAPDLEKAKVRKYFKYDVKPSLVPLALDATRPLPNLKPFSIYIVLFVKSSDGNERVGLIEVPSHLDRIIKVGKHTWCYVEDMIIANIGDLYPGAECSNITAFRVIRDGDVPIHDDDKGYVQTMAMHARSRILYNKPVRLDIWRGIHKKILDALQSSLDMKRRSMVTINSRLKMSDIIDLYKASDDPELKYPHFKPADPIGTDYSIMREVSRRDIIVHHPYESFNDTVLKFIREACEDPHVISIKQTLYRSGADSKIVQHLIRAAEAGKSVTVVMEIKARFDEETNIEWAEKLQRAGAIVVYGYEDIKTHAKMLHIFRKKGKEGEQFCHIGTGNYSEKNSKVYTDFSYFTSNKKTCSDINNIFNMLTGGLISSNIKFHNLHISPLAIRDTIYSLIDDEMVKGEEGYVAIKVNNLSDHGIVEKLYKASNAGVKIHIICRGSCSLVPGLQGYSENIRVMAMVGRFLEHGRVMIFGKDEAAKVYITSSDLMTRNLDRRVELMFGIENIGIKEYLKNYISQTLWDNENAYLMTSTGDYVKVLGDFNSQTKLIETNSSGFKHI
jgi:polyphosphate kinase